MADAQRLEELRRRVQRDPASLAFAQLAEECRRSGLHQEAVRVCREGLSHHPDYLSARVTLGRALLGLDHLDQAGAELAGVLRIAPENLAALRGLAEVQQRRGLDAQAHDLYRAALALAPHDPEILAAMDALDREPPAIEEPAAAPPLPPPSAVEFPPTTPEPESPAAAGVSARTASIRRLEAFLEVLERRGAQVGQGQ